MLSMYSEGKKEEVGGCLSSQVAITCDGALPSWRWLKTCLPMGSSEHVPCFALLLCMAFAFPIERSLSQLINFLSLSEYGPNTFTLLILSLTPVVGE